MGSDGRNQDDLNAHLAAIVQDSNDVIISMDFEGRVITWNAAAERAFGYSASEMIDHPIAPLIPPERKTEESQILERVKRGESPERYETVAVRKDNALIDVSVLASPVKDDSGTVVAVSKILREITARKKVDAKRMETNNFLDSVIENIPDMIFVKDAADLRFVRLNRAGEELLGCSRDDLLGKNDYDFFPKAQADHFTAKDREVLAGERMVDIPEEPIQTRAQGERILHTKKIPIIDQWQRPRYLLGISEDVTERKQKEREILRLNAALAQRAAQIEAAHREMEVFSYSISHDLRAPLRHINGYVVLLTEAIQDHLDDESKRLLKVVADAGQQMNRLIDDLLTFARMGQVEMREGNIGLSPVVRETIAGLEMLTRGREILWTVADMPTVRGDLSMLRQVFSNLLGNAVKYSAPRNPAHVEIGCEGEHDGKVVIFVRDDGVGFDMKHAHKLFGVFQRLHKDEDFEGTGIGLANVRRIVARHGGRIWAEAAPGQGATFYFTLKPATPDYLR